MRERAVAQEGHRLPGRFGRKQQAAVAGIDDDVVLHARKARFLDRDRAVVGARAQDDNDGWMN